MQQRNSTQITQKNCTLLVASKWEQKHKDIGPKTKLIKWLQQGNPTKTTQKNCTLSITSYWQ